VVWLSLEEPYYAALVRDGLARRPGLVAHQTDPRAPSGAGKPPPGLRLHWGEYEDTDWDAVSRGRHGASAYYVRRVRTPTACHQSVGLPGSGAAQGVIRKAQLAFNTRKWAAKHPSCALAGAIPETHTVELQQTLSPAAAGAAALAQLPDGLFDGVRAAAPGRRTCGAPLF
jgi:hypothetical protein